MPSLFHTLNVGSESLYATRQGVDTAGHNIANAQVEGYSRQRINLRQRDPLQIGSLLIGNGNYVGSISRLHDNFIEKQINRAGQDFGRASMKAEAMNQLQVIFSPELNASVADEVSNFFNAMQDLSNFPEDFTVRTGVAEAGKNVAAAFRRVDTDLKTARTGFNEQVADETAKLTDDLAEIANLNIRIQGMEAGEKQDANDLRDQRDRLLREVSNSIEINYYEDQHGMLMVRGPKEVTLVDGGHSSKIDVVANGDNGGLFDVVCTDWETHGTRNLTEKLGAGKLDALVEMRDEVVPDLLKSNNESAFTLASSVNAVHREGFGLKDFAEQRGRDFFNVDPNKANCAANIDLDDTILSSVDAIAGGLSPLAPGDNVNIIQMLKLKDERLFGDGQATFNEHYANYVGALGLDVTRADHVKEATDVVMQDLTKRREAVSGVSLDEEATNLLKWQANFTASSKVITTVDEMLDTVLQLKR
jgi:flagellar hook-associated protein 1 FlgK